MKVICYLPIIVLSVFVPSRIPVAETQRATLYEHTGKGGRSFKVNAQRGNCVKLPSKWRERASSVNTHNSCVIVYANSDCTGKSMRIRPEISSYISNLKRVRFNDVISSVKACQVKNLLKSGRYAIQNVEDGMYLTARHILQGFTMVETEKWQKKISQQWDILKVRDGTYWLIPRIHVSKNRLTYEMRKLKKEDFPEIGMFKERVHWVLESLGKNKYVIKNDDTGNCLTKPDDSEIEEDECESDSKNQQWIFYQVL